MNLYLRQLSEHYSEQEITLVMDGAGWHKSKKLVVPTNIAIVYLPPYCPEFNPIERLWLYVKSNVIRNKVHNSLDELEDDICTFLNTLSNAIVAKICVIDWVS